MAETMQSTTITCGFLWRYYFLPTIHWIPFPDFHKMVIVCLRTYPLFALTCVSNNAWTYFVRVTTNCPLQVIRLYTKTSGNCTKNAQTFKQEETGFHRSLVFRSCSHCSLISGQSYPSCLCPVNIQLQVLGQFYVWCNYVEEVSYARNTHLNFRRLLHRM